MARKRYNKRNGSYVGIFPEDHEIGFVAGRKGIRRVLISIEELAKYPEEQQVQVLDQLYHAKQYEILNAKAKEREEKKKKQRLKNKTTLKQASNLWLSEVESTQSAETHRRYKQTIALYFSRLPDIPASEFGRDENIAFFHVLAKTPKHNAPDSFISANTQNKHMRHFQVFINWCFNMEYINRPINLKKAQRPQKEMETLSEADLDKLEKHLKKLAEETHTEKGYLVHARKRRRNKNMYRAFILARHTLLRSGAIWSLQLDKFSLSEETPVVRIRDCVVETRNFEGVVKQTEWKSKKMKWPNKPINKTLLAFLEKDLTSRKPEERYYLDDGRGYAWHEQTGKIARELKIEIKKLGMNIDLKPMHHGIRASGITWLLNQGVPPQVVQHLADHSNLATTMGYYNTRKTNQEMAVNLLG